jgi:hypothetical protein
MDIVLKHEYLKNNSLLLRRKYKDKLVVKDKRKNDFDLQKYFKIFIVYVYVLLYVF